MCVGFPFFAFAIPRCETTFVGWLPSDAAKIGVDSFLEDVNVEELLSIPRAYILTAMFFTTCPDVRLALVPQAEHESHTRVEGLFIGEEPAKA